jgi:hypothetical protein
MGKIIRPPEGTWSGSEGRDQDFVDSGLDGHLNQELFTERLLLLTALRKQAPASYSWRNVQERRLGQVKDANDKQLFTWINRSTTDEWRDHPSFFDAIIAELKSRDLIPTPEDE